MRLDKFLCDMRLGTRSQVKEYVRKGSVSVNGAVVKSPDFKLDADNDIVSYMGKTLVYKDFYYYMLHKPSGVVTATVDRHDKTVMDLMAGAEGKGNTPVGRLDKDTEGLLLVTNDGGLAHSLLSPKKHVEKTYYAECAGTVTPDKIAMLESGVDIGDKELTRPAKVKLIAQSENSYTVELTITEGRFHQVKRMVHAVGGSVTYLKRLSMGSLVLDPGLPKGAYRPLTENEIFNLKNS